MRVTALPWAQSEWMISNQRPNQISHWEWKVGWVINVKGITATAFSRYLGFDFGGWKQFKFYSQVSGRLFMSTFSTVAHLLLLTPLLLVTQNFGLAVVYRPTCFMISKIPPKALKELTEFPRLPSWRSWRSWGSLSLSPRTTSSALGAETRPPLLFRRHLSYVITSLSVVYCLWSVTLLHPTQRVLIK